jgi:hypothetical protein
MIDSLDRFVEFDDPGGCQLLYIEHSHQRRDVDLIEYCWKYHLCIAEITLDLEWIPEVLQR